jgi:hypothetical protein
MKHTKVMETLDLKFTSGNSCPVTRATITREEYSVIKDMQERLEAGIASLYQLVEEPEWLDYLIDDKERIRVALAEAGEAYLRLKGEYL